MDCEHIFNTFDWQYIRKHGYGNDWLNLPDTKRMNSKIRASIIDSFLLFMVMQGCLILMMCCVRRTIKSVSWVIKIEIVTINPVSKCDHYPISALNRYICRTSSLVWKSHMIYYTYLQVTRPRSILWYIQLYFSKCIHIA